MFYLLDNSLELFRSVKHKTILFSLENKSYFLQKKKISFYHFPPRISGSAQMRLGGSDTATKALCALEAGSL